MISTLPFSYSARVLSRKISFGGGWGVGWERADFAKTQYENALLSFGGSINLASRENRSVHWKKIIHKLFFLGGGGGGSWNVWGVSSPPYWIEPWQHMVLFITGILEKRILLETSNATPIV